MRKTIISAFLCLTMLFSFCGCAKEKETTIEKAKPVSASEKNNSPVNLLCNTQDSLNPYTAATVNNRNLCKLIFEPLVKADNNFKPVKRIAKSVKISGKKCTVKLIDAVFSDGTPLTASDVIYCYNSAKNSSGIYKSHLYEVTSVSSPYSDTVVFNLSKNDPYFANLLDFPIFKANSENRKNSDGVTKPPIGCGRYVPNDGKTALTLNNKFFGKKGEIKKIVLINAPDSDSESHYIEIGATEMYYSDLKDGKVSRMSGMRVNVNLNNFVYLGINLKSKELHNRDFRYAVSSALDRKSICQTAYYNNALPATGYFNPMFTDVSAVQTIKETADSEIIVENLKKIGYNKKDSDGYYVKDGENRHSFKLIVNSENRSRVEAAKLIAVQLKNAGIAVNVSEEPYKQYLSSLKHGYYDFYIGEISVLPNFDMSELVIAGGSASYGVAKTVKNDKDKDKDKDKNKDKDKKNKKYIKENTPTAVYKIMTEYDKGLASISDVAGTLLTELIQIPICYRQGLFFYQDEISSGVISCESDIYFSVENYKLK